VVWIQRRRLTPAIPAARMTRATRLRPTATPTIVRYCMVSRNPPYPPYPHAGVWVEMHLTRSEIKRLEDRAYAE
jgi:hypothetical protein